MKVVTVVGERPQFKKTCCFPESYVDSQKSERLLFIPDSILTKTCRMSFFNELEVQQPKYDGLVKSQDFRFRQ